MEVSSTMVDKISRLSSEDFLVISTLVDRLFQMNPQKSEKRKIGVAKDINFPSNFDEIDYGIEELFGLRQ